MGTGKKILKGLAIGAGVIGGAALAGAAFEEGKQEAKRHPLPPPPPKYKVVIEVPRESFSARIQERVARSMELAREYFGQDVKVEMKPTTFGEGRIVEAHRTDNLFDVDTKVVKFRRLYIVEL